MPETAHHALVDALPADPALDGPIGVDSAALRAVLAVAARPRMEGGWVTRRFVVTAIQGDTDITKLCDPGPQFLGVMVDAANNSGESVSFRRPLDNQPHVGDIVEFDEVPESAIYTREVG